MGQRYPGADGWTAEGPAPAKVPPDDGDKGELPSMPCANCRLFLLLVVTSPIAIADSGLLYRWTDGEGRAHFYRSPATRPRRNRRGAGRPQLRGTGIGTSRRSRFDINHQTHGGVT